MFCLFVSIALLLLDVNVLYVLMLFCFVVLIAGLFSSLCVKRVCVSMLFRVFVSLDCLRCCFVCLFFVC